MVGQHIKWVLAIVLLASLLAASRLAEAQVLSVVNVSAPAINCVFSTSCTTSGIDTSSSIPLPGSTSGGFLQSRTIVGRTGAPAAGFTAYLYRVDLTNAIGITNIPCVTSVKIPFGPVSSFQYNGTGPLDQVFVVTGGGSGTIGLSSAVQSGDDITFTFSSPVCAGGGPPGASSFFFGLTSTRVPSSKASVVTHTAGGPLSIGVRAPNLDRCTAGGPFTSAADPCTTQICAADSFCCNVGWDSLCVSEVSSICHLSCP
jgi:hypothetical protein